MQADTVHEVMAAAARHSGCIFASVEEQVSLKLFVEPLNAFTDQPTSKSTRRIFPRLRMHVKSTLIHNNIHNPQTVIHKLMNIHELINIHESTLFEISPGENTDNLNYREGA